MNSKCYERQFRNVEAMQLETKESTMSLMMGTQ